MFKSAGRTELILKCMGWALLVFSILCSFSTFSEYSFNAVFSADAVGLPLLHKDLMFDRGHLKDWYFAAAPIVFPDFALYSLIRLCNVSIPAANLIYALFQVLLIVWLSAYIFKKSVPVGYHQYTWLIPLFFSFFVMESFYFSEDSFISRLLSQYSYHTGSFVNCMIALAVVLSGWRDNYKYMFLFVFSALACFSDMLFIVMFTVPFILSLLFTLSKDKVRHALWSVFSTGLGSWAGIKVYHYVKDHGISNFYNPHKMYAFDEFVPSLKTFVEQLMSYIGMPGFRSFLIFFSVLSLPVVLFLLIAKRKTLSPELKFFFVFYLVFSVSVTGAPLVNGNYSGYDTLRYNVSFFYFAVMIIVLFCAYLIQKCLRAEKTRRRLMIGFPAVLLLMVAFKFTFSGLNHYVNYYPPDVRGIDSLCDHHQLKKGISWYWGAKHITAFSKKGLQVVAVHPDGYIYELGSNIQWYFNNEFDFIITDNMNMDFSKTFRIKDTLHSAHYTIFTVDKFVFQKSNYAALTK
jgi:hypothetical protein